MPPHNFEKSETLEDLFDNALDLIQVLEPDGTIVYVNKAWSRNLGFTEEEVRGKPIYTFVQESDREWFERYREEVINGRSAQMVVFGMLDRNGAVVHIEGFVSAKFSRGKPLYTRGIFRDVTQRLQSERELKQLHLQLKEREANLRQLFHYAPDAIVVIDAHSIIRYWNPKAEQIFGWTQEEVLGTALSQVIIPEQYRAAHEAGMKRYLSTGETRVMNKTIEISSMHKEGREFFVALTISATRQNGALAFVAFIRDIHQQKLDMQELEQKRVMLERSNEELEQFAHVASHDMKEPVRKILMFSDMLRREMEAGERENLNTYLGKIETSAARLASMVEGVLTTSSVKGGEFVPEKVDLNEILRQIEIDLEIVIGAKKAVIRRSALPVLEASPFLMYQLFYNLINNSLKFSRPDVPPVIELSARPVKASAVGNPSASPALAWMEILLRDNGIGFPQEYARHIFKTFSRLNSKEKYEGTGIGLSLCKAIVEKHGGYIEAFGTKGEGAEFMIYLPESLK